MQSDMMLVTGLVLGLLAFPALLNAFSESRFPRLALFLFLACAGLVASAVYMRPGGYTFADVPHAFIRVVGFLIN